MYTQHHLFLEDLAPYILYTHFKPETGDHIQVFDRSGLLHPMGKVVDFDGPHCVICEGVDGSTIQLNWYNNYKTDQYWWPKKDQLASVVDDINKDATTRELIVEAINQRDSDRLVQGLVSELINQYIRKVKD